MYSTDLFREQGCCGGANGRLGGLGLAVPWGVIAGAAIDYATGAFSGDSRRGGEDPCCPGDPAGIWPRNSNQGGAPPDYRSRGTIMEQPSPSGSGRIKDDVCDCVPIPFNGRWWAVGNVVGGVPTVGVQNVETAIWIEVDPNTGRPTSMPSQTYTTSTGGSGTFPTSSPTAGSTSWVDQQLDYLRQEAARVGSEIIRDAAGRVWEVLPDGTRREVTLSAARTQLAAAPGWLLPAAIAGAAAYVLLKK